MAAKKIAWPTLQMIRQIHYPLIVQHQPLVMPSSKIPLSPAPPPCAESGLLGDNLVDQEANSLKALAVDGVGQLGEIEPKQVFLKPSQQLGVVEPECECPTLNHRHQLIQVWKHPNSHVSRAGRYKKHLSATSGTLGIFLQAN